MAKAAGPEIDLTRAELPRFARGRGYDGAADEQMTVSLGRKSEMIAELDEQRKVLEKCSRVSVRGQCKKKKKKQSGRAGECVG